MIEANINLKFYTDSNENVANINYDIDRSGTFYISINGTHTSKANNKYIIILPPNGKSLFCRFKATTYGEYSLNMGLPRGFLFDKILDENKNTSPSYVWKYAEGLLAFPETFSKELTFELKHPIIHTEQENKFNVIEYKFRTWKREIDSNLGQKDLYLDKSGGPLERVSFNFPEINIQFLPALPIINNYSITPTTTYTNKLINVKPTNGNSFVTFPYSDSLPYADHAWYYGELNSGKWRKILSSNTEFNFSLPFPISTYVGIAATNDPNKPLPDVINTPEIVDGEIKLSNVQTYNIFKAPNDNNFTLISILKRPVLDFNIIISPASNYYILGQDINFTVEVKNSFPLNELSDITWTISSENIEEIKPISSSFVFIPDTLKKYTITASATDKISDITVIKSIEILVRDFKHKFKKVYFTVPPEQRQFLTKEDGSQYSLEEIRDELYNSIVSQKDSNSLFLAIRTWPEAGKIIEVSKETRKGIPCVGVLLQRRIGARYTGIEDINYNDLPKNVHDIKDIQDSSLPCPRGSIFSTLSQTRHNSINLSSVNSTTFEDTTIKYRVRKEGLENFQIVLFSQNKTNPQLNAFGGLKTNSNIDFSIFPFQPYMTLLLESNIIAGDRKSFYCASYTSSSNNLNNSSIYRNESFFSIKPFDNKSLKFRDYQDLDYSHPNTRFGYPDILSWNDNNKYLAQFASFLYKGPRSFTDAPIYEDGKPHLKYYETGILYSKQENSNDILQYNDFNGPPFYYGNEMEASRASRLGFFETLNNISHNIGNKNLSEDVVIANQHSIINVDTFGNNNSSISNIINKFNLGSKFLSKLDLFTITPVNVENRYIAYSTDNKIFLWDQYNNIDLGPYNVPEISGTINNLIGVRDFISDLKSNYFSINPNRKTISWLPLSPKYFNNIDLFLNLNYNYSKNFWDICTSRLGIRNEQGSQFFKETKSINLNEPIPQRFDTNGSLIPNLILTSLYENSIFFSNKNKFGFSNINKNSYVYSVDKNNGNILENTYGAYQYKNDISFTYEDRDYLSLLLNEENEKQTITIMGERNGIGFLNNNSIILADKVTPSINSDSNKFFIEHDQDLSDFELFIKTNQWVPDRISVCGTQLQTIDDYITFFKNDATNNDIDITNVGTENIIKIKSNLTDFWKNEDKKIVSGNHLITVGLESWPTGSAINGKRCNYEQVNLNTLIDNFSTSIVVVNTEDIKITNQINDRYITTSIVIYNAFISNMPIDINSYIYNTSENTLEIRNIEIQSNLKSFIEGINTTSSNMLDNCTLILEDTEIGKKDIYKVVEVGNNHFKISLPPVFSPNPNFYVNQLISSFSNKRFAIAAFAPNQILYFDNQTSFSSDRIHLSIKDFTNNSIIYETTNYIANSNLININLYEKYRDDYIKEVIYNKKILINSNQINNNDGGITINSESSRKPHINVALYRNYNPDTKVFTNDFIRDKFNRFNSRYNLIQYTDKIYIKITSNVKLDLDKSMKFVIKNLKNTHNNDEEIIYNNDKIIALNEYTEENKRGSNAFLVEIQPSIGASEENNLSLNSFLMNGFNEIEFFFEGYNTKGILVQYGNSISLN